MATEKQAPSPAEAGEVAFEDALHRLEAIVDSMETDDLALESLLSHFEEGTKLYQVCQAKLNEAELKIQQLEQQASGDAVLKPVTLEDSSNE